MNRNIRDYEVSVWTLQDSFITVLKPSGTENKGRIEDPDFDLKNDGTLTFKFSIPMYLKENNIRVENPIWYNTRNGNVIADLRKIKVIFHKNTAHEQIFELLITSVSESHEGFQLTCDVECEGLAFHELGKIGYKLSLNYDTFIADWNEWVEKNQLSGEPKCTIDYWNRKILKDTNWSFEVRMDWSGYGDTRNTKIIYEDSYAKSWNLTEDETKLIPGSVEHEKEKERLIDISESNLYNITQTIAETFGVHCRYEYEHDANYHIIGRKVIYYNNFVQENLGPIDINYNYDTTDITRKMDSKDVITKMYVKTLNDGNTESGLATISDTLANKSQEDYLLNFDYLYSIGTISQEQYNEIEPYEIKLHKCNETLKDYERKYSALDNQRIGAAAKAAVAKNAISLDNERISATNDLLNAITDNTGTIEITSSRPEICPAIESNDKYYITMRQKGVIPATIHIYKNFTSGATNALSNEIISYTTEFDEFDNLIRLVNIPGNIFNSQEVKTLYLTYKYQPKLYYENILATWTKRLAKDQAEYNKQSQLVQTIEEKLAEIKENHDQILTEKENIIKAFERLMGPALREGFWQPDDEYGKYGEKCNKTLELTINSNFSNEDCSIGWDDELFDNEEKNYYELTISQDPIYYPCIDLTGKFNLFKNQDLSQISFIYQDAPSPNNDIDIRYLRFLPIGSQSQLRFIRSNNGNIKPVLMLTGLKDPSVLKQTYASPRIGILTTTVNSNNNLISTTIFPVIDTDNITFVENLNNYTIVYPRIKIASPNVKNYEDSLILKYIENAENKDKLANYNDYYVFSRGDENDIYSYYITINPEIIFKYGAYGTYEIFYELSNTSLFMYLDALQVLKENAYPRVSYEIKPAFINTDFINFAYKYLNYIVNINDPELKFEYVKGYITELHLKLDSPQEDTVTIDNYKTKFEDLFTTIVAQTEQMKKNSTLLGLAAQAFTPNGGIQSNLIQSVMNRADLDYAFNDGTLTINEEDGIWGTSESGVVAFRGGGIFTATEKDDNDEWIWNTGILPSGINASLITTGQLDTNLIRIFAGNNLRLQMNGEGLFAYKQNDNSNSPDGSTYVVHNENGLFLHENNVNRVAITWDGLTLRDKQGNPTLYADSGNGNLTVHGTIEATALKIYDKNATTENKYITASDYISNITNASIKSISINGEQIFIKNGNTVTPNSITLNTVCAGGLSVNKWQYYGNNQWNDIPNSTGASSITILNNSNYFTLDENTRALIKVIANDTDYTDQITLRKITSSAGDITRIWLNNENINIAANNEGIAYGQPITVSVLAYTGTAALTPIINSANIKIRNGNNLSNIPTEWGLSVNNDKINFTIPNAAINSITTIDVPVQVEEDENISQTVSLNLVRVDDGATGATGASGYNQATLYLYQRSDTNPGAPAASSGTSIKYNFSTGVISNYNTNWKTSLSDIPDADNDSNPIWVSTAIARAKATTVNVTFSTPRMLVKNGADGTSVTIKASLNSINDLPSSNNMIGDGYIIDNNLWIYTGTDPNINHGFVNVGQIKGKDGISSYLFIYYSEDKPSDDSSIEQLLNNETISSILRSSDKYIGIGYNNTNNAPALSRDYSWSLISAPTLYELVISDNYIVKSTDDDSLNPSRIVINANQTRDTVTTAFNGYYKIYLDNNTTASAQGSFTNGTATYNLPTDNSKPTDNIIVKLFADSNSDIELDSQTLPIIGDAAPGADAYTVVLSNENHTFTRKEDIDVHDSTICNIQVYKGTTLQQVNITKINNSSTWSDNTILVGNDGIQVTRKNNNTATASLEISTNNNKVSGINGSFTIELKADNHTFIKTFTYSFSARSITNITEEYATNNESNNSPNKGWSTLSEITWNSENPYLWNREKTTYNDGSTSEVSPHIIAIYTQDGAPGVPGRGIQSIINWYKVSSNTEELPNIGQEITNGWSTEIQSVSSSSIYLWNYEHIAYTDGNSQRTEPAIISTYVTNGTSPIIYELRVSDLVAVRSGPVNNSYSYSPSFVTLSAEQHEGNTTTSYLGYYVITGYKEDGSPVSLIVENNKFSFNSEKLIRVVCELYSDENHTNLLDTQTIALLEEGVTGEKGDDAYTVLLNNEYHTFSAQNVGGLAMQSVDIIPTIYKGTVQLDINSFNYSNVPSCFNFLSLESGGIGLKIQVKDNLQSVPPSGTIDFRMVVEGNKEFTVSFSYAFVVSRATVVSTDTEYKRWYSGYNRPWDEETSTWVDPNDISYYYEGYNEEDRAKTRWEQIVFWHPGSTKWGPYPVGIVEDNLYPCIKKFHGIINAADWYPAASEWLPDYVIWIRYKYTWDDGTITYSEPMMDKINAVNKLDFSISNNKTAKVEVNSNVGVKITDSKNNSFQVNATQLGFFDSEGHTRLGFNNDNILGLYGALYVQNGDTNIATIAPNNISFQSDNINMLSADGNSLIIDKTGAKMKNLIITDQLVAPNLVGGNIYNGKQYILINQNGTNSPNEGKYVSLKECAEYLSNKCLPYDVYIKIDQNYFNYTETAIFSGISGTGNLIVYSESQNRKFLQSDIEIINCSNIIKFVDLIITPSKWDTTTLLVSGCHLVQFNNCDLWGYSSPGFFNNGAFDAYALILFKIQNSSTVYLENCKLMSSHSTGIEGNYGTKIIIVNSIFRLYQNENGLGSSDDNWFGCIGHLNRDWKAFVLVGSDITIKGGDISYETQNSNIQKTTYPFYYDDIEHNHHTVDAYYKEIDAYFLFDLPIYDGFKEISYTHSLTTAEGESLNPSVSVELKTINANLKDYNTAQVSGSNLISTTKNIGSWRKDNELLQGYRDITEGAGGTYCHGYISFVWFTKPNIINELDKIDHGEFSFKRLGGSSRSTYGAAFIDTQIRIFKKSSSSTFSFEDDISSEVLYAGSMSHNETVSVLLSKETLINLFSNNYAFAFYANDEDNQIVVYSGYASISTNYGRFSIYDMQLTIYYYQ